MSYTDYDDWYDDGPGSESFKRNLRRSNVDYAKRCMDKLKEMEDKAKKYDALRDAVCTLLSKLDRCARIHYNANERKEFDEAEAALREVVR